MDFASSLQAHDHPLTISAFHELPAQRHVSTLTTAGLSSFVTTSLIVCVLCIGLLSAYYCYQASSPSDDTEQSVTPSADLVDAPADAPPSTPSTFLLKAQQSLSALTPLLGSLRDGTPTPGSSASPNPFSYIQGATVPSPPGVGPCPSSSFGGGSTVDANSLYATVATAPATGAYATPRPVPYPGLPPVDASSPDFAPAAAFALPRIVHSASSATSASP